MVVVMRLMRALYSVLLVLFLIMTVRAEWINGLTIEAPRQPYAEKAFSAATTSLHTNWVAVVPYGFIYPETSEVQFNTKRQWWGESREGIEEQIRSARKQKQRILLKPQIWLMDGTYTGHLDFKSDKEWASFEASYRTYLLHYLESDLCRSVDALCIGTEFENSVEKRPQFWKALISEIRKVYSGPITYAANWDVYREFDFWEDLDAIGVNAYFPIDRDHWKKWKVQMKSFSDKTGKPVIFTEFGYRSVEATRKKPWEGWQDRPVSEKEQKEALELLLKTFWTRDESSWFKGGFLWKWHLIPSQKMSYGYTVQDKGAERVVKAAYQQMP